MVFTEIEASQSAELWWARRAYTDSRSIPLPSEGAPVLTKELRHAAYDLPDPSTDEVVAVEGRPALVSVGGVDALQLGGRHHPAPIGSRRDIRKSQSGPFSLRIAERNRFNEASAGGATPFSNASA